MDSRFVRVEEDLGQNQKLWRSLSNFSILALSCFTSYNYQTVLVRVAELMVLSTNICKVGLKVLNWVR